MFKVPDWGDDIPKGSANFEKRSKKKDKLLNQDNSIKPTNVSQNGAAKKKNKKSPLKAKQQAPKNINEKVNLRAKNPSVKLNNNPSVKVIKPSLRVNPILKVNNKKDRKNNQNPTNNTKTVNKRKKRKVNKQTTKSNEGEDTQFLNTDVPDEVIINVKKRKLNKALQDEDREDVLFKETGKKAKKSFNSDDNNVTVSGTNKTDKKKEKLKEILAHRTPVNVTGNKLRERMLERLKAAQFRYLNEKLYTSSGSEAHQLFQTDPAAFQTYHQGYQLQLKKWPVNPLDVIVKKIIKMPKTHIIADMGCGEAALRKRVPHTVRSFDLVSTAEGVEECDMAHTPLLASSVDVAVYCLALMGTQLTQYLVEANRVLKNGGHLLIAEVESRFDNVDTFTDGVQRLGFKLKSLDKTQNVFFFMEFVKIRDPPAKKSKLPELTLKPCLYKRR